MSVTDKPLLRLRDVAVEFHSGASHGLFKKAPIFKALDEINLTLRRGETLGLIGESGSGKTTLGKAILGLTPVTRGEVGLNGTDLASLGTRARRPFTRHVQMVFQDPYSSLHPRQTVGQTLAEPLKIHGTVEPAAVGAKVAALLERVGLCATDALRYPRHFSGGQRQRIAIARAIANDPDLIIADEPVSALDVSVQAQILNLMDDLRREQGMAMLFISHDLSVVRYLCQRIAVMYLGRIVEIADTEEMIARPAHPYTTALLSAAPRIHAKDAASTAPIILTGDVPSHAAIPSGCPFHTRCWLYRQMGAPERCRTERPPLSDIGGRQSACFYPDSAAVPSQSQSARTPDR